MTGKHAQMHESRRRKRRHRRGVAMLLVLIAVGVAMVLSASFIATQATGPRMAVNAADQSRARQIAESGAALAMARIKADASWRTNYSNGTWVNAQSLFAGTLTIKVEDGTWSSSTQAIIGGDSSLSDDPSDPFVVTATATYGNANYTTHLQGSLTGVNTQTVLMIVGNASTLATSDQARKTIIQTLGWTVNVIAQNASASDLTDAVDDADVVYVSSTVSSTSLASTVKAAEIGVVSEPAAWQNDLGATSADGTAASGASVDIATTSHYITQTLSTGSASLFSSAQPQAYLTGSTAVGAVVLANRSGTSSGVLVAIDEGATLQGGGAAAARRVFTPWSGSTFDPNALNTTGKTLLDRCLKWAGCFDGSGSVSVNRHAVSDYIKVSGSGKIDSFQASLGAYGGANVGTSTVVCTNSTASNKVAVSGSGSIKGNVYVGVSGNPSSVVSVSGSGTITGSKTALTSAVVIPAASVPGDMPATVGDKTYSSGTTTLSGNLHVNRLTISNNAILQISGQVSILADKQITIQDSAQIKILSGGSLVLYGKKSITIDDSAQLNVNTAKPANLCIYATGSNSFTVKSSAQVYATIVGPSRTLTLQDSAKVMGCFMGKRINVTDSGILSLDVSSTQVVAAQGGVSYTPTFNWADQP